MAPKKRYDNKFFSPLSFIAVFGSGIQDPGWVKIRIRDKHPGSATLGSRIPDPKTATKERGGKKFDVIPFYVDTKFTKLYIILVLKC
jgi:hypothetical protein